jgi:ParB family chromosome partitioning protein
LSDATSEILVDEVSLAENIERAPLHPLDQFRAFHAMREKGMTEEAIATAFFVGVNVVKQRMRFVVIAPNLLDVYADDGMTLEQLTAFTVSPTTSASNRSGTPCATAGRRHCDLSRRRRQPLHRAGQ